MRVSKWLHVTRGGVNAYLTPTVKSRPIRVTGSKGIHGTVFSELPSHAFLYSAPKHCRECIDAQELKRWQNSRPSRSKGKQSASSVSAPSDLSCVAKPRHARSRNQTNRDGKPDYVDELGTAEFLLQLLMQSDFVVLLLASVPSTFNIIGENELRAMKKSYR